MNKGVMRRRPAGVTEDKRKRTPPVRLGRRLLAHLRRWVRLDGGKVDYVCHLDGKPVAELRRSWPTAVQAAGLAGTGVTPHCLRRTRATWLMQAGIDLFEAAGHLGMTVKMLTETYAQHHPDWQKDASEV